MPLPDRAQKIVHRAIDLAMVPLVSEKLVVTGFWRSGTTWILQQAAYAIGAKTIFEPLAPSSGNFWADRPFSAHQADREMYMPLSTADLGKKASVIIEAALNGRGHTGFAFFCRTSPMEAFRTRTVSKFTRAGFLLNDMIANTTAKFIHVRRHPGAVYASLKSVDWDWSVDDFSLERLYGEVRADEPPEIRSIRQQLLANDYSPLRRVAALWALSERSAHLAAQADDGSRVLEISYSDLLTRQASLTTALSTLGFDLKARPDPARVSPVTSASRHMAGTEERLHSWQNELSLAEKEELRAITTDLFPEMAHVFWEPSGDPLPLGKSSSG
ncbi:MAG: hypothetical protein AAFR33_11105 [Pseudomonadota bacterium]